MPKNAPIKYTNRDFDSIKQDLLNYAKVYYPETYKDYSEASFGSLLFDMVAYVGDILSFAIDYSANEAFLDSAIETKNILRLAKQMGFKYPGSASSTGICAFYVTVPAKSNGKPNDLAVPILMKGTTVTSKSGAFFVLNENVDFSNSTTQVVVAEVGDYGVPRSYAYKAYGEVVSGKMEQESVDIGEYKKFLRVQLEGEDISEIVSVIDSQGHEYFEVDFLSQNVIYRTIRNRKSDKEDAPYILREMIVPRRFVAEYTPDGETFLQFGYGSEETLKNKKFPDPSAVVIEQFAKDYYKDNSFDPNLLSKTEKFGVVPPSGELLVSYRKNTASNVNVPVSSVATVANAILGFGSTDVSSDIKASIRASVDVDNEAPIVGQIRALTPAEIRMRAIDTFASQNRAVTKQDYLSLIYRMPGKFGAVKRANIVQDSKSFKRNLNLYIISENSDNFLIQSSETIKQNLKTWLNKYRMINDTIDILDGRIVNFGIEFELVGALNKNPTEILSKAVTALKKEFSEKFLFGVPFYISEIYKILNDVEDVIDTRNVKIVSKRGADYSEPAIDVETSLSDDGRFVMVPEDVILELKHPDVDIVGVIV
tara:strand:+ start:1609 stop:3393 length:1785 start_codon:yes stop_codon:yes gene_type:complete